MSRATRKAANAATKVLTLLLAVLLILGVAGFAVYLLRRPQGLYLTYGDEIIDSRTSGIYVPEGDTVTFRIDSTEDWGVYTPADCTVKIVPNVSGKRDFEFRVTGEAFPSLFSELTDLTAAFVADYDGSGLPVNDDGTFTFTADKHSLQDILSAVYADSTVIVDGEYSLKEFAYIALSVTSPDGKQTLTVPVSYYVAVEDITLDKDGIIL